jgi:ankyrin repeat domain-containing protein 50
MDQSLLTASIQDTLKPDRREMLLTDIRTAELKIQEYAHRKSFGEIRRIYHGIEDLKSDIMDVKNTVERIEQKISTDQSAVDQFLQLLYENACPYEANKDRNPRRVAGTCNWFTNHRKFVDWNSSTPGKATSLLYVTADPGCGKSVLSRYLIDEVLDDDERKVCYFFFKDDDVNQKSAVRAVCALLHQLFDWKRDLVTDAILNKHKARGAQFFTALSELWKIFSDVASHQETVCVLDALDECQTSDMKELIQAITTTQVPNLKVLMTSRPYDYIRAAISRELEVPLEPIHLQGGDDLTADEIVQEIKLVVENRIEQTARYFSLEQDQYDLMKRQFNDVPNRTYLWVSLVFDGLIGNDSKYESSRGLKKSEILGLTRKLPQSLDAAYEKLLNKNPHLELERKRALQIIVTAKRPMSLAELSVALAFTDGQKSNAEIADSIVRESNMKAYLRNLCGLFVSVIHEKVYLLHQTAREFLVRQKAEGCLTQATLTESMIDPPKEASGGVSTYVWKYSMKEENCSSILADICISYLYSNFIQENDAFIDYSATYWADHYRQSEKEYKCSASEKTMYLCQPQNRTQWIAIQNKHQTLPKSSSIICLASALGLEIALGLILWPQGSIYKDIEKKANLKEEHGRTPLSWAARYGHVAVVKQLLEAKADIESRDKGGRTPLSWAAFRGHEDVVKKLLEAKANIEPRDKRGRTPLLCAAFRGHANVVKQLLEAEANVESRDNYERTPLLLATDRMDVVTVKQLLESNANIEAMGKDSRTPLSVAARRGQVVVVRLLLEAKANVMAKDGKGWTPLTWAVHKRHDAVVKQLKQCLHKQA